MVTKTKGIVIKHIKYRESSIITHMYTEKFGLMSFIVHGVRSPKSKKSIGYFQPLSLLDLVVYYKSNREIQQLSEYKFYSSTFHIQQDIRKSSIALFLSEVLSKLLVHEQDNSSEPFFQFISTSIISLENLEQGVENFHLHFLLNLLPHLGIGVSSGSLLVKSMGLDRIEEDEKLINFITILLDASLDDPIQSSGKMRYHALELILNYIQHHTVRWGDIKSLKVLQHVFS